MLNVTFILVLKKVEGQVGGRSQRNIFHLSTLVLKSARALQSVTADNLQRK